MYLDGTPAGLKKLLADILRSMAREQDTGGGATGQDGGEGGSPPYTKGPNSDEDEPRDRKLRYSETKSGRSLIIHVDVQVPAEWMRLTINRDGNGFLLSSTSNSKDRFRMSYFAEKGYYYTEYSYRKGVLRIVFEYGGASLSPETFFF